MKFKSGPTIFSIILFICAECTAQINPVVEYPDLFKAVQEGMIFKDQKTFLDCRPLRSPDSIMKSYNEKKNLPGFDLKTFVTDNFDVRLKDTAAIFKHIDKVWNYLTREPEKQDPLSSLIALPHPYIVPGGRFREIYYWDSYFTMLGLKVSGKISMIKNMTDNFAFLIDAYGYVPNGNRTYYLSRSQPPYFSLMVDLLAECAGDSVYLVYLPRLEKEYRFWMEGSDKLNNTNAALEKAVLLDSRSVLNRYCDRLAQPRPESYLQDVSTYRTSGRDESIFRDLRSAAESGWDFSSRWLKDASTLGTIITTEIVPVDLNCLLYHLEITLCKAYTLGDNPEKAADFAKSADERKRNVIKYCWNPDSGYFYDYNFKSGRQTLRGSLAGLYPLFFQIADTEMAMKVKNFLLTRFLLDGGLVTTTFNTGQQWDFPNGWAPLQWIGYVACKNYGFNDVAHEVAVKWTNLNARVFFETGKMLEKYNVADISMPGGGGEYELQDGFGWTNGVFLKLWYEERNRNYIAGHD